MIQLFENFKNDDITFVYHTDYKFDYSLSLVYSGNILIFEMDNVDISYYIEILESLSESGYFKLSKREITDSEYDLLEDNNFIENFPPLNDLLSVFEGKKLGLM